MALPVLRGMVATLPEMVGVRTIFRGMEGHSARDLKKIEAFTEKLFSEMDRKKLTPVSLGGLACGCESSDSSGNCPVVVGVDVNHVRKRREEIMEVYGYERRAPFGERTSLEQITEELGSNPSLAAQVTAAVHTAGLVDLVVPPFSGEVQRRPWLIFIPRREFRS